MIAEKKNEAGGVIFLLFDIFNWLKLLYGAKFTYSNLYVITCITCKCTFNPKKPYFCQMRHENDGNLTIFSILNRV